MSVNFNLYRYFFAVIENGSMTKAAEKMHASEATVSYSIKVLEQNLGEKLFQVGYGGVIPGKRAWWLYRNIKPVFWLFYQVLDEFANLR